MTTPIAPEDDVLALTPVPLQTAGERALFAELARWDTGGSVRAAVVASLPLADGPLNRRLSDAVLFVPEGLAVVRIVEVVRQSGVVTVLPEGAWSIAAEGGPSQVLQLAGGGSTPLDGLMRAGMDVAVRLRQAGMEPGRIARLTVLVGNVTGLVPEDGDLGEGDLVARLEPRSLLLAIARASRYAAVDNPRLWATADVRAALEALSLPGRGPSVEELNGEGFPYSPYVLRRPGLLTPANMAANAESAREAAAVPAAAPEVAVREQPAPEQIAQAVAASVASARSAGSPGEAPAAPAGDVTVTDAAPAAAPAPLHSPAPEPVSPAPVTHPRQDTVHIDGPPAPPTNDSGGIGGLFANAEPLYASSPPPAAAGTSVFSAPPAPRPMPPIRRPSVPDEDRDDEGGGGRRTVLLAAVALLLAVAIGVVAWSLLRGTPDGSGTGGAGTGATETTPAGPEVGAVQEVAGVAYRLEAVQVDDTCVGHSYGDTADFFATTNCTGVSRALYSAELDGGPVVVSVSRVQMADPATARQLQALTDRNGSGNISDLLREGVRYTGSPDELSDAEYASALNGSTVTIVESAWVAADSAGVDADIDLVATNGLALETPDLPAD
ncbi:MAG: uncharacterized protein JWQ45_260 [Blastococcus sp.]|nr:uncharacterized protein [Blastococcus sp.]